MKNNQNETRIEFQQVDVNPSGEFEILAMTAGEGNSWQFPAEVLRNSVPLWENVHTFIDHHWFGPSLHDLAGICHSAQWDEIAQGVRLKLKPVGPAASLLTEMGQQILQDKSLKPNVGFSADLVFNADVESKKVSEIIRVFSVDLVVNPARGGEFIRQVYQKVGWESQSQKFDGGNTTNSISKRKGVTIMEKEIKMNDSGGEGEQQPTLPTIQPIAESIKRDQEAVRTLLDEHGRIKEIQKEADKAKEMRLQMCQHFLESALQASKLPSPAQDLLRSQFKDRIFEADELQKAIGETRTLITDLTAGSAVQGPRISAVFNTDDKLQAAVDDLLGAPRSKGSEGLQVASLSGIRELYLMLTGDYDLHGGFNSQRVQFATTADFTGLVKNALNKIVTNTWDALGKAGYDWWTKITRQEHFGNLNTITGTLVGTVGSLPVVAEGAEYTELAVGDSPETADFVKYGGYIPLTLELIDRDESRKLAAYPRELAAAGLRKISSLVAAIFTSNAGVGPTMADTGALFNNTAVTTAGGHANLLTTALAAAEWDVVSKAVYDQPMLIKNAATYYGTGDKMAINPRYCVVPRALQLTAMKILYPTLENATNIYSENMQRGQPGDVVTVPEWTDATDWAAVCDPVVSPAIYVGERFGIMPEVFIAGDELSPAVFMNDEHRLKVRHFLAVWVNDFRPLHKSNVAG